MPTKISGVRNDITAEFGSLEKSSSSSPVSQSADIYGVEAKTGMLNLEMNRFQTLETKEKELEGCAINIKIRKFNAVKRGGKRFLERKKTSQVRR